MIEPKPLSFRHYQPREDHPDWKDLHEQAVTLAREIVPLIHTDADDTAVDKTADRLRKAKSLATGAKNYFINRRRWSRGNHALRPLYFIWTLLYKCNFRCTCARPPGCSRRCRGGRRNRCSGNCICRAKSR